MSFKLMLMTRRFRCWERTAAQQFNKLNNNSETQICVDRVDRVNSENMKLLLQSYTMLFIDLPLLVSVSGYRSRTDVSIQVYLYNYMIINVGYIPI